MKKQLKEEEKFHDNWAESINIDSLLVDEYFSACTCPENKIILNELGSLKGKKILDMGCGAGESSVYFAKQGAKVIASDISAGMLKVVKKLAKKHNTSLITAQCYSHKTPFKKNTFDIVYAANLLHHVTSHDTLKEVHRILKKGGIFVSWDPLAHNIFINIYRKIATKVRTDDERPINFDDLNKLNKYFSDVNIETTWLFTQLIFMKYFLIDHINPNKERYWKKIVIDHKKLEGLYRILEKFDIFIIKTFPFLRRYCWNVVICGTK